jgi:alcohol-forming fatty acyl-CoA reductase
MREIFVSETYEKKSILVTGATGFLGKVLVEKLLRDCKGIVKIYLFIRGKKSDDFETRFTKYKNLQVFDRIRKEDPQSLNKLFAIQADIEENGENFGIDDENLSILKKNVNFIFHCAATVKFDESIEVAISMNTIGTQKLLNLAESFENLDVFVHVSTAYSNINQTEIHEKIYEPICSYERAIKLVQEQNMDELLPLAETAASVFPNTYIFSKHLTEKLVSDRSDSIPIVIIRPSIVCPSFEEPFEGWVDNYNGIMAVLPTASTGLLRVVYGKSDVTPDLIPCDFVVNSMVVAAASMASNENKNMQIFNCTTSQQKPITWNELLDTSKKYYRDCPSTNIVWYPDGGLTSSYLLYLFRFLFFQLIPACILDLISLAIGKKTWAIKLQLKIFDSMNLMEHFIYNSWKWRNSNFILLHKLISLGER